MLKIGIQMVHKEYCAARRKNKEDVYYGGIFILRKYGRQRSTLE
jgi:hypothetical protein